MQDHPTYRSHPRQIDRTGQRFGMLMILGKSGRRDRYGHYPYYECECDCGKITTVHGSAVIGGTQVSCGCRKVKHRLTDTPLYLVWRAMISRCCSPGNSAYHNYGGRGIGICDRWRRDFRAFLDDMGPRPDGGTVERIDVNGDYSPENCRWATAKEQGRNKRTNRFLELDGDRRTLAEWSESIGISVLTISQRLNRGWSVEDALTRPLMTEKRKKTHLGRKLV